jgi:nicotinamide mononucleotide transporter
MEILTAITTYFSGTWGMVELTGTVFSLICVYLATKHNQWTWFFGALGVILFGLLFFEFKLYSDALLQILFFLPMQVWGFYTWRSMAEQASDKSVTKTFGPDGVSNTFVWGMVIISIIGLTVINGALMATYTDASFPYADAFTTWMSVFAQVLMIRKFWESWVLWIVMDVVAIGIYFAKGLFVVSGLYFVFLILATIGLIKWYNDWKAQQTA